MVSLDFEDIVFYRPASAQARFELLEKQLSVLRRYPETFYYGNGLATAAFPVQSDTDFLLCLGACLPGIE